MPRLFIGVPAPDGLDTGGVRRAVEDHARDVKLVDPEHYHVTLAFLGDTQERHVPTIEHALREAADGIQESTGQARGLGAFPDPQHASVVWIGIDDDTLPRLAQATRASLDAQDIAYDDRHDFHAHLTVARLQDKEDLSPLLDPHSDTQFGPYPVEKAHLYESTLTPKGPQYEIRETVHLEDSR